MLLNAPSQQTARVLANCAADVLGISRSESRRVSPVRPLLVSTWALGCVGRRDVDTRSGLSDMAG